MSLEVFPEKWLVLSALMIFTWQIAERFVSRHGSWAWKLFKVHYAPDLPFKKEPLDSPLGPTTGIVCFKVKKYTKPTKCAHKSGEGVKKPLKPVHGHRQKDKCRLYSIAGAALSPLLLFNCAVAQVPTFEFHSEVDRIQTASDCYHGFLSIKDISSDNLDMIRLQAVMPELPQGLLGHESNMHFIVDSGASKTSTFDSRDFVPGSLKLFERPPVLTGISGSLEIKGQGDITFQVLMDGGAVKEITTQAYWIPDMKWTWAAIGSFPATTGS